VIGLTKTIAREYAGRGITANAIAPGFIASDMTAAIDKKYEEGILKSIPLGGWSKGLGWGLGKEPGRPKGQGAERVGGREGRKGEGRDSGCSRALGLADEGISQ
jgi:NAD(P)-dependent dehydrogenase (short-subunit alcohol dehydrogenase family)